jgi:hypothetical protein
MAREGSAMEQWRRPMNRIPGAERRKHKRFRVQTGAFAALCPQFNIIGQIVDISTDGLAFRYVAREERSKESSKLSILLTDGSFCFDKIPFEAIWDASMPHEFSLGDITLRQCGVQFGELTPGQKLDLQYFVGRCSLSEGCITCSDYVSNEVRGC